MLFQFIMHMTTVQNGHFGGGGASVRFVHCTMHCSNGQYTIVKMLTVCSIFRMPPNVWRYFLSNLSQGTTLMVAAVTTGGFKIPTIVIATAKRFLLVCIVCMYI